MMSLEDEMEAIRCYVLFLRKARKLLLFHAKHGITLPIQLRRMLKTDVLEQSEALINIGKLDETREHK